MTYTPVHKIRMVTAASLFDGHDAAINIMRRILQSAGVEVIHLGHNRAAADIVAAAVEEDVHSVAITSYQGGHMEFFRYVRELLDQQGCNHIRIFGGGGGTILPEEILQLQREGITRIYSPDDGRTMGLTGMIEDVVRRSDYARPGPSPEVNRLRDRDPHQLAAMITMWTEGSKDHRQISPLIEMKKTPCPVLGITGTGGAGKSTITDEFIRRFLDSFPDKTVAILSVDPSRKKTGGALLADRIRMNVLPHPRAYMRSLATRGSGRALGIHIREAIDVCQAAAFDLIVLESAGIGQEDTTVTEYSDLSVYVMTPEYGAATQLEKIAMLDYADIVVLNKSDKTGADDAWRDVRKQYQRNHGLWDASAESLPVLATIASRFNDPGMQGLFSEVIRQLEALPRVSFGKVPNPEIPVLPAAPVIPPARMRYLAEITEAIATQKKWIREQSALASRWYCISGAREALGADQQGAAALEALARQTEAQLDPACRKLLGSWETLQRTYRAEQLAYTVRDQHIRQPLFAETLSHLRMPRIALPTFQDWGDILRWLLEENVPGAFPYTAGVFPLKREGEDPTRMFAGEGTPEQTNRRFHYLSLGQPASRLSTAFDSVTLYGEDPDHRPDIFGKVGNAGVSVATLDDVKKLYSGFPLCDPKTSVSMTINGPAPILLACFLNAAIDQRCEQYISAQGDWDRVEAEIRARYPDGDQPRYQGEGDLPPGHDGLGLRLLGVTGDEVLDREVYARIKADALQVVRGTVQADILKEDQAQNTCIFSNEFALRMMGDIQAYFTQHRIQNFYSVSISGYHIAEAGANPITQLAFTLANGFTYVEYYLSRGMAIDDFAPNLSFFFSNGMDAEYTVIGRVARRIWARAMKYVYGANERSQKLKYHIQTSGRSLHAQEIDFNDIRTTLQALYAIYDNCNSLHTNAYDEAITTPTEESVRRAMAIQLIINRELGSSKNQNFIQGSFFVEELTGLVEEAVLAEFNRLSDRGGVLGAMERMYQRNKIQEESLDYESLKNRGDLPIVGVNTFLNKAGSPTVLPGKIVRSSGPEKESQIRHLQAFQAHHAARAEKMRAQLRQKAVQGENLFEELMETVKCCSLGQITHALFAVGGQYRRSM